MSQILSPASAKTTVEFFGIARQKADRAELQVSGHTVAQLLDQVERACPRLNNLLNDDGSISRHFLVSIDGHTFVDDPAAIVPPGAKLLVLGADAGG
jgi:molybdopterin converting factor small subunit